MPSTLKQKVISGVLWRSLERFGTQGIGFVVSVVLARLLGPEEYGTVALLTIFLAISSVFVNSGFWSALVQKEDADDFDFNSIFYFNIVAACLIYVILWISAPWIAHFYNKDILKLVLRVSALNLVINSTNGVQTAILAREMKFHLSFRISLCGTITYGVIGILMAYRGYGLWALVFGSLGSSISSTIAKWLWIGWRPSLIFSLRRVQSLFSFGSKLLASELLETFFNQLYCLIIGKCYSPAYLAYFNKGESVPNIVMSSVQGVIGSVVFPALSRIQNDKVQVKAVMRRVMMISTFLVFPMMYGLAVVAKPLVVLLFTEKWVFCVPYLQLACVSYALYPVHVANLQVIQACGRSDIFLRLEVIKKILALISIGLTFRYGVMALALGRVVLNSICVFVNVIPCKNLIGYPVSQQMRDVSWSFFSAIAMAVMVFPISFLRLNNWLLIAVQCLTGTVVYVLFAYLCKTEAFVYLLSMVKPKRT